MNYWNNCYYQHRLGIQTTNTEPPMLQKRWVYKLLGDGCDAACCNSDTVRNIYRMIHLCYICDRFTYILRQLELL